MKRCLSIAICIVLLLAFNANAQETKFGWNAGSMKIYYDAYNNGADIDYEILCFNWLFKNKLSLGFNVLNIYDSFTFLNIYDFDAKKDVETKFSVLPLEIAYVPLNIYNQVFLSIYGKGGLQIYEHNNKIGKRFYGSIGLQFFIFPEMRFYYSPYLSLFAEYSTDKKIKIGLGFDTGIIAVLVAKGFQLLMENP
jgi:hypothetical protein